VLVHSGPQDAGQGLARTLADRVPALTDRLVDLLVAEDQTYRKAPPDVLADVRRSCDENLRSVLRDLSGRRPSRTDAARETARRRAEQGVPLASLLHAYRLGMRVVWEAMNDEAPISQAGNPETLMGIVTTLWELYDAYASTAATAYDEALVDLARRDERQRTLVLDDLLEGRDPGGELRGFVARTLELPEHGPYVAVAADVPARGGEGLARADQVLRGHGVRSAWRLRADEQVGIVAPTRDVPAEAVRALLAPAAVSRAGISPPYADLGGTARAVALAGIARRTVPPGTATVATLDEHPLGALVAGAPEMAVRLARIVLGGVLDLEETERALLLETLAVWVDAGGSASEAGRRLFCHRNTVRNRLARLEELSGRSLADPRAQAELWTAAEAVRLLGVEGAP
jgi:hypothetical protein